MDDSAQDQTRGEILKASSPGAAQIQVGMDVTSFDGERIGRVKQVAEDAFLLDRPLARDLWVPFSSVISTEDYTANFRGPVQPAAVVLSVSAAHVEGQGWRHA
jgi:hypothetical protein